MKFYKEEALCGGIIKKRGSFFRNHDKKQLFSVIHDPIAKEVSDNQ